MGCLFLHRWCLESVINRISADGGNMMYFKNRLPCWLSVTILCCLLVPVMAGCSKGDSPTAPQGRNDGALSTDKSGGGAMSNQYVWGIYDVTMNDNGEFVVVPLRNSQYTLNVN